MSLKCFIKSQIHKGHKCIILRKQTIFRKFHAIFKQSLKLLPSEGVTSIYWVYEIFRGNGQNQRDGVWFWVLELVLGIGLGFMSLYVGFGFYGLFVLVFMVYCFCVWLCRAIAQCGRNWYN